MRIECNGQPFNACRGMTAEQVTAVFEMYAGPRKANTYTFALVSDDGQTIRSVTSTKKGEAKSAVKP